MATKPTLPTLEDQVSLILENILGLLGLEGSFEVTEGVDEVMVTIEADDPARLIGFKGETLDSLQLIVNLIISKQLNQDADSKFKRVVVDVANWRKNKEADLERRARNWAEEVLENAKILELDPMPSWQRRIVHMVVSEIKGVESESVGEGRDRHLIIKPSPGKPKKSTKSEDKADENLVTDQASG